MSGQWGIPLCRKKERGRAAMTGKEILEAEFEKAGMRGGYKADDVDSFLQQVATAVDQQAAENSDLKYKMQILADKIEEYKAEEENIREALLGAQKLGSSMLNESKAKAEAMTREAKANADDMMAQARAKIDMLTRESKQKTAMELNALKREYDMEQRNLEKMKQEVSNFKAFLLKQYKTQLQLLTNLPSVEERTEQRNYEPREPEPEPEPERTESYIRAESVPEEASVREDEEPILPAAQTISSEITSIGNEIEQEEKEQTREFGGTALPRQEQEPESDEEPEEVPEEPVRRSSRPNYIEKFGELKFGGFSDSTK